MKPYAEAMLAAGWSRHEDLAGQVTWKHEHVPGQKIVGDNPGIVAGNLCLPCNKIMRIVSPLISLRRGQKIVTAISRISPDIFCRHQYKISAIIIATIFSRRLQKTISEKSKIVATNFSSPHNKLVGGISKISAANFCHCHKKIGVTIFRIMAIISCGRNDKIAAGILRIVGAIFCHRRQRVTATISELVGAILSWCQHKLTVTIPGISDRIFLASRKGLVSDIWQKTPHILLLGTRNRARAF